MGIFIEIKLNQQALTADAAAQLVAACPVDIFAYDDEQVIIRSEQVDECTLCELCLDVAPAGALTIRKLYNEETLVSRG